MYNSLAQKELSPLSTTFLSTNPNFQNEKTAIRLLTPCAPLLYSCLVIVILINNGSKEEVVKESMFLN